MERRPRKAFRDGLVLPSQRSEDLQSPRAEDGAQHSAQPPLKVPIADGLQEPLLLAGTLQGPPVTSHPPCPSFSNAGSLPQPGGGGTLGACKLTRSARQSH